MGNAYDAAIGERFCTVRNLLGITLTDAASELGCTRQTLGNYETGKTPMRVSHARQLSKLYGASVTFLLGETDSLSLHDERNGRQIDVEMTLPPMRVEKEGVE